MSEFLTVRLSSEPQSPVQWLVWSTSQQEVIASGELSSWEQLGELTPYAEKRSCIALLPGNECLIKRVEIPKGAARQFDSMLPFLLEDEVAQDIEDLHLTILDKDTTHATVCGVDRAWLSQIMDDFKQVNITVRKVLPDILALPVEELQMKVSDFNVKELDIYSDEYDFYDVYFIIPEGKILASYDNKNNLLSTAERYKDIDLPSPVLKSINKRFPNWMISKNVYLVNYHESGNIRKMYKITLQNGNKRIKIKVDDHGDFL